MPSVCFYFQVHQPHRLRRFSVFDRTPDYFDEPANREVCRRVATKCYLPANRVVLDLIRRFEGRFKVAYSVTGTAMEQFEHYSPEVLASFRQLADTGCVEFLAETYHHSLAWLYSEQEFKEQVAQHHEAVRRHFDHDPRVFRNTELIYDDSLARAVSELGYEGICTEGVDHLLGVRSCNFLYEPPGDVPLKLLLKNYRLSDDIAFRFSDRSWPAWPLTAEKFAAWVSQINGHGHCCNLFLDYEALGEHQWAETGIFDFLRHLPGEILKHPDNDFATPGELLDRYPAVDTLQVPTSISWADTERDLSAFCGNAMQSHALQELFKLEKELRTAANPADRADILADWRRLSTSDHVYYMATKSHEGDSAVHRLLSPYDSPYDGYINFMNVLDNLSSRVRTIGRKATTEPGAGAKHKPAGLV